MRGSRASLLVVFSVGFSCLSLVQIAHSQARTPPVAQPPAVSDAELDKLYTDVTTGEWDQVAHPAVDRIAKLDHASKAKLVPRFMKVIDSEDHAWAIEEALGAIGAPALPELIKAAQHETGARQQNAITAISHIEPRAKSAIPVLIRLSKTTDKDLRASVIGALATIGPAGPGAVTTPQVVDIMMAALNDDVAGCESTLARYGAPLVPGLRKLLQTSADDELRERAVKALMFMGSPAAPAVPELMLAVKNPATRESAIYAFAKIGPAARQALPVLKKVVMKDPEYWSPPQGPRAEDRAREYAMEALSNIGVDTEFLIQAMKDGAPGAAAALSRIGPSVVPTMRALLSSSSETTAAKVSALLVLSGLGPKAEPAVPEILQSMADKKCRMMAANALIKIGPGAKPAVPLMIYALRDEEERDDAMMVLGAIGPDARDAVPYLIDILQGKPEFAHAPLPPGYQYVYGEQVGERGRMMATVLDQFQAEEALKKIGTPEALAAVKEYEAKQSKK
jgi:HEAT repeat protein